MSRVLDAIAAAGAAARRCCRVAPTRAHQIATAGGHSHAGTRKQALSVVLTALMIGALFMPLAASGMAVAQPDDGGPPGLEKSPGQNFNAHERAQGGGPPDHALENIPTHAAAWDVHASDHADTLETTVDATGDELALVLSDERNHAGREVAISADALEDSLGERPSTAFGEHSSGDSWSSSIDYRNGYAVIDVPKFSENEVTFSGTVSLTGDPAEDGTSYMYELSDDDEVDDLDVELTGVENSESWASTDRGVSDGETWTESIDGSTDATVTATIERSMGQQSSTFRADDYGAGEYLDRVDFVGSDIVVGSDDTQTVVMYDDVGTRVWDNDLGELETGALESDGQNVVVGSSEASSDARLVMLDASDGSVVWDVSASGIHYDAAISENYVAASSQWGNNVYLRDRTDGSSVFTESANNAATSVDIDETADLVVAGTSEGELIGFDTTGNVEWEVQPWSGDRVRGISIVDGDPIAMHDDGIKRIDGSDGSEIWSYEPPSFGNGNYGALQIHDGEAVARYDDGLVGVDPSDGTELWTTSESEIDNSLEGANGFDVQNERAVTLDDSNRVSLRHMETTPTDPSVSVGGTTVVSESGDLDPSGASGTELIPIGDQSAEVSVSNNGQLTVELDVEETTESVDPAVVVNGDRYDHFGTLSDGESTTLDVSKTSLQSGENDVEIIVAEDSDGPIGEVGLDYSHAAVDEQSVDYSAESWSERYNVSKTFAADQNDATLTIPHAGTVIDVRDLEIREDDGDWATVASSNYDLDDTELTIDLGDVAAGTTIDVRSVASKVDARNGEITVTDPTVLGDDLSSEIQIDEYGDDFEIGVGPTIDGNEIHYTYSESWSNSQSHARVDSSGEQALRLPNAGSGETTRLSTIPLEADPIDGHVDVRVRSSGAEPEFDVLESSDTSEVEYTFLDATSGLTYQLFSLTGDYEIDRGEASSPVTLTHDGSAETLAIFEVGSGSGGGTGGTATTADTGPTILIGMALVGLVGIFVVSRRMGDESVSGSMVLVAGTTLIALLSVQAMAPGAIARAVAAALEEALPLVILGAVAILFVWLRSRGDDVTLELGDSR